MWIVDVVGDDSDEGRDDARCSAARMHAKRKDK